MGAKAEDSKEEGFEQRLRIAASRVGNVTALAKAAGIPQSTIRGYFNGNPPLSVIPKLARAANVSPTWLAMGEGPMEPEPQRDYIRLQQHFPNEEYLRHLGISQEPNPILMFRRDWLRQQFFTVLPEKQLSFLFVAEHGMEPTFHAGDIVLLDHMMRRLRDGFVHLIRYKGDDLGGEHLKRLRTTDTDSVSIISDNPEYPTVSVPKSELDKTVEILGCVVWVGHAF